MSPENKYEELLEEVCEKINNIDSVKEIDVLDIKNSLESIENLMTDTQTKLNFDDIKEKLEAIAVQVENCNEAILKDLYTDINGLKEASSGVSQHIENLQNVQNLALTSAEFEEFQKQQLDLALKTNENIFNELAAIKESSQIIDYSPNIQNLSTQLENLHIALASYIEQMTSKFESTPKLEEIGGIVSDLNSVQQKSIRQTGALVKDLQTKFLAFQSDFKYKEIENQLSKISEIYDSLGIIHAWIEKVGYINKSIENVYARLGESIDFDDVAEKVDIIFENINSLNKWTKNIDNIDLSVASVNSKIDNLSISIDKEKIADIQAKIGNIKERFDSVFVENIDFDDLANKMDIIYENIGAINEWASKVDVISEQVSTLNETFEEDMVSSKVDLIYENIGLLNEWVNKIDDIAQRSEELDSKFTQTNDDLNGKIDEITDTLSKASKIIEDVPNIKDKLQDLSNELNAITHTTKDDAESYIYTLLDIESDFLKLHKFVDDKTRSTSDDINSLKEKFAEINDDISSISIRTNKLILSADDANKEFKSYLDSFKNIINSLETQRNEFNPELKYALLSDKISEMFKLLQNTVIANKNLNNAFMYFAEWVDATGNVINSMSSELAAVSTNVVQVLQKTENNTKNIDSLKDEFTQLHLSSLHDVDKTSFAEDLGKLKQEIIASVNVVNLLEEHFEAFKNQEISEIRSALNGVMVQLGNITSSSGEGLNEKIEKLSEQNNHRYTELEVLLNEKINQQSIKIASLEDKIENLTSKFEQLIGVMSEEHNNYDIKDTLGYIASQLNAVNEVVATQQNSTEIINQVAEKLSSFDTNINKIVSYIEED